LPDPDVPARRVQEKVVLAPGRSDAPSATGESWMVAAPESITSDGERESTALVPVLVTVNEAMKVFPDNAPGGETRIPASVTTDDAVEIDAVATALCTPASLFASVPRACEETVEVPAEVAESCQKKLRWS
jgi:hypothetical protein